tara:strand:- start:231 stop:413 length:183 start_codon:yes stop_codon:yes gene_type:complete
MIINPDQKNLDVFFISSTTAFGWNRDKEHTASKMTVPLLARGITGPRSTIDAEAVIVRNL